MLILVGESASGKSTVEKVLVGQYGYKNVISYTTRNPRVNEVDGVDYHYITDEEFKEKTENDFFAEITEYNGWWYGCAKEDCTDDKVAVVNPYGLRQLKANSDLHIVSFYIDVPRRDRLIKILQRGDDIEEAYRRSLSDVGQFNGVDFETNLTVSNDGYRQTPEELAKIIHLYYQEVSNE